MLQGLQVSFPLEPLIKYAYTHNTARLDGEQGSLNCICQIIKAPLNSKLDTSAIQPTAVSLGRLIYHAA